MLELWSTTHSMVARSGSQLPPLPPSIRRSGHDLSAEVAAVGDGTASPVAAYFHTNLFFRYKDVSAARSTAVLEADILL